MVEIENQCRKATEENALLRANLEKEKDKEIRNLSLENETKLQKNNHLLEKEIQELKIDYKTSSNCLIYIYETTVILHSKLLDFW